MNIKLLIRFIFRETLGLVFMAGALLGAAGKMDWWPAWAALGVMLAWSLSTGVVILRFNPALLAERLGPRKGAKGWDKVILSLLGLTQLVRYILSGLDQRYAWTGNFPLGVQIFALVVCGLGYSLVTWATASNAFFSQVVRIQSERGQTVETGGPYRVVRHPAYLGAILYELAVCFLLSSWGGLAVSGFSAFLLIVRTALEDRMLQSELPGYSSFASRVRWRLIPGLW